MTFGDIFVPLHILWYGLTALFIVLIALIIHLEIRVHRLLAGKDGKCLEDSILHLKKGLAEQEQFKKEMTIYLTSVEKRLARSLRSVETVRFNAFKGTGSGGNMSFATAYLNEKGDGVVISTLNARERIAVFAKTIKNFKSDIELSPEESEAISNSKKSLVV